jgi:hypothetical protein
MFDSVTLAIKVDPSKIKALKDLEKNKQILSNCKAISVPLRAQALVRELAQLSVLDRR